MMRVSQNLHANLQRTSNRQRNAGKVETVYGTKRFMSVATIRKMNKASLDDWLFQRGFMPEAFDNVKEKKQVLIDDLRSELNAG
mgnify:CR=1 FL=1|tara:strand:+ start:3587 stop:3838 length:252 start_codon:yes stop_codon:yes gene_type:complete